MIEQSLVNISRSSNFESTRSNDIMYEVGRLGCFIWFLYHNYLGEFPLDLVLMLALKMSVIAIITTVYKKL